MYLVVLVLYIDHLGKTSTEKNVFFRALPKSPNPPPWPQFGQLGPFFPDVKIQDLKVTWGEGQMPWHLSHFLAFAAKNQVLLFDDLGYVQV